MSVPRWSKKGRAGLKKAWARREKHRGREMVRLGTSEGGKGIKAEHPGGEEAPGQAVARAQPTVQPGGGQRRQRARGSDRSIRCRGWAGPSARQRRGNRAKYLPWWELPTPPTAWGLKSQSLQLKALRLTHMGNKFEASRSGGRVGTCSPDPTAASKPF